MNGLDRYLVIDLTRGDSGAVCTEYLALAGMNVIRVEEPLSGEVSRAERADHIAKNLNKKTVTADGTTYTYTVYPPDMDYAVMSASAKGFDKNSEEDVSLLFKPAFTAFEFNLTSADEEITVTKVELAAAGTTDRLAGTYLFTAGSSIVHGGGFVLLAAAGWFIGKRIQAKREERTEEEGE